MEPQNRGALENASGTGISGVPGGGPFFVFQVRINEDQFVEARFQSHTCGVTVASGSVLTELVIGRSCAECQQLNVDELTTALGGVPVDKQHVTELAVHTMQGRWR